MTIYPAIPASHFAKVLPNVVSAGANDLSLNGVLLTSSTRVPIGTVPGFASSDDVGTYFGEGSPEQKAAIIYFDGFTGSTALPGEIYFWQYPAASVAAYLRGGNVSTGGLAAIQALTGTVIVTVDGGTITSGTINLSTATSFSAAAAVISAGLAQPAGVFTGSQSLGVVTISAVSSGTLAVGDVLTGTGYAAGTVITSLGTGTGGVGTYNVSTSHTVSSTTTDAWLPLCTYDILSGAFVITSTTTGTGSTIGFATGTISTGLNLTSATGAVTSQGAVAGVPGTAMDAIKRQTTNWASFSSIFEPVTADKVLFATWTSQQLNRYLYAMWDVSTAAAAASSNDTSSAGYQVINAGLSGTVPIYLDPNDAYFLMGFIASLNFTSPNGRSTWAFKGSPAGLTPTVTDETVATNLEANGYNYYGKAATNNAAFIFAYPGSVTGPFAWIDSYVNQIWMNASFQLDLMNLLTGVGSIPYDSAGYAMIENSCMSTIEAAIDFGAIRSGVELSSTQIVIVNNQAGVPIDGVLFTRGWYMQVIDPGATVRGARGSPNCRFWYTDGGSIQKIDLTSTAVL